MSEIRLTGLPKQDFLELQKELGSKAVQTEDQPDIGERHGELGLLTVIVTITPPILASFAMWLGKPRRTRSIKSTRFEIKPDGSTSWVIIEVESNESEAVPEAVLDTLKKMYPSFQISNKSTPS